MKFAGSNLTFLVANHPKQTGLKWFVISWKILVLAVSKTLNFGSTMKKILETINLHNKSCE